MTYLGTPVVIVESFPESGIALVEMRGGRLWTVWLHQLEDGG